MKLTISFTDGKTVEVGSHAITWDKLVEAAKAGDWLLIGESALANLGNVTYIAVKGEE